MNLLQNMQEGARAGFAVLFAAGVSALVSACGGSTPIPAAPTVAIVAVPTPPLSFTSPAASTVDWSVFSQSSGAGSTFRAQRASGAASLAAIDTIDPPRLNPPLVNGSAVTLSWTAGTVGCCELPSNFIIQYGSSPAFAPSPSRDFATGSRSTTLTINNVPRGTYYVRLIAYYDISGRASPVSNEQAVTVACTPVTPVLTSTVTGRDVFLAWTRATPDDLFEIEVDGQIVARQTAATFTNSNTGDGTYQVRVRIVNSCGTSDWSNQVTVTVFVPSSGPLTIQSWRSSFNITLMRNGYYRSTGTIDLTLNRAVTGTYRAEFNAYPFLGATKSFSNARDLHFDVTQDSFGCPDFHNTIPLYLYDSSGRIAASVNTTHRGSGCAFN